VAIGARSGLAKAYEQCARNDGAILQFLERIKEDPANAKHHFDLGRIYSDKGLIDQAVNEWENTTKLDPLYCPAYHELANVANKNLDSATTIIRCQDFVACVTERSRNEPVDAFADQVDRCKALVRKLEME
jgi:tetratricopeptide (TPR) repeat protein